ncbi:hypothetical protein J6590_048406 [Homalodisca vitripennis]|nr:hypothetical protein J6590_048406 [Homalodisca vitripennis]
MENKLSFDMSPFLNVIGYIMYENFPKADYYFLFSRPLFWGNEGERESKSQEQVKAEPSPTVASVARAQPTNPTPIGESLKMVTKQLLQSPEATDMVATDIRTPPKIKTQHLNTDEFVPVGKGEAIPLDADNIHSYQVVTNTQYVKPATAESTPASGISTWILLNGSEQSTQASQKKQPTKPLAVASTQAPPKKKVSKPIQEALKTAPENVKNSTFIKSESKNAATITKVENPKKTQQSVNQEPLVKIPALMLQDAKFKNKTPIVVGRVPSAATVKNKPENIVSVKKSNATNTPITTGKIEALAPQSVRRKVSAAPSPATTPSSTTLPSKPVYQYELVPTTSVIVHTDIVNAETTEEVGTTETPTTTTKRTRKPGTKKRKKNKNRRRRPSKKPDGVVESKITEENNSTRIAPSGSRPLSTRIYNYLSREIMPTVGVGIVGLVLTAGLAGLLLYPFGGGVAARRTYEKSPSPSPDGHMYYYNEYNSNGEVDNGQPEETVFGQVLAGMQQTENKYNKYSRPQSPVSAAAASSPTRYSTQSKYRYDPSHEYGYQTGYQKDKYSAMSDVSTTLGRNPEGYSTLPDSASLNTKYSPSYSLSGAQYTGPSGSSVITQYGDPKYTSSVSASIGTGYDDQKYTSSVDTTSGVQYNSKYSSSIDSNGNSDSNNVKYSTLTGLSVEPQNSKYSSVSDDQSTKYSQSSKYSSLIEDQESKYHQNPKYTSMTDSQNTKYTSMTDNQNSKYPSVSEDKSSKYPTPAEYTAYSNPSEIGTQSGSYTSSNHKQTGYADIEYDETKSLPSLTEEDKSDKSQPTFSALHASDDSYSNVDSMSMFSGSYNNEVRHRQGVLAVEHGPRNIKLDRQKRQIDLNQNEVDGSLPDEQTTTERGDSTTTDVPTTEKSTDDEKDNSSPSHENTVESTTWSMPKEPELTTVAPSRDHGFFGFLRRLAQMKLRMGLELLRSTTHAVARYLDTVQKRMENVVRDMDKKTSRQRREIFKKAM